MIFDEAHELEDVASSYFGISLSNVRFEELARDLETMLRAKQALSCRHRCRLRRRCCASGRGCSSRRCRWQGYDRAMAACRFSNREEFLETQGDVYLGVMNALHRLEGELERVRGVEEAPALRKRDGGHSRAAEVPDGGRRSAIRSSGWSGAAEGAAASCANTYLQATPIDVSELLQELLFENFPSVVLTSATLTVQGGFAHIRKRLGMRDARELVVPSHFNYGEQALLYLPPEMPDPREPDFQDAGGEAHSAGAGDYSRAAPSASSPATSRCAICMSGC